MIQFIKRNTLWRVIFALLVLATIYWGLIASDRYVSEAHVVVERTDSVVSSTMDFSSLLGGASGQTRDLLLLRDHLLSTDMLTTLDKRLNLRSHYAGQGDWLSRMWSCP